MPCLCARQLLPSVPVFHIVSLSLLMWSTESQKGYVRFLVIRGKTCYTIVKPSIPLTRSEKKFWNHLCSSSLPSVSIDIKLSWKQTAAGVGGPHCLPSNAFSLSIYPFTRMKCLSALSPSPLGQRLYRDEEALGGSVEGRELPPQSLTMAELASLCLKHLEGKHLHFPKFET